MFARRLASLPPSCAALATATKEVAVPSCLRAHLQTSALQQNAPHAQQSVAEPQGTTLNSDSEEQTAQDDPNTNAPAYPHKRLKQQPSSYLGSKKQVSFPARVSGIGRRTTVRDVMRALAAFQLREDQVRVQYNEHFLPTTFWLDFATSEDLQKAAQSSPFMLGPRKVYVTPESALAWKSGIYHPFAHASKGRFVLVTGIQENATMSDVQRHFAGYHLMVNGITFLRSEPKPRLQYEKVTEEQKVRHRALVRMTDPEEAARAVRNLTNSFLLNQVIRVRTVP